MAIFADVDPDYESSEIFVFNVADASINSWIYHL